MKLGSDAELATPDKPPHPAPRDKTIAARGVLWLRNLARRPTLAREIIIVLAIKVALLSGLKHAFFNDPQAPHMALPPQDVAQALLSVSPQHAASGSQSEGIHHAP